MEDFANHLLSGDGDDVDIDSGAGYALEGGYSGRVTGSAIATAAATKSAALSASALAAHNSISAAERASWYGPGSLGAFYSH